MESRCFRKSCNWTHQVEHMDEALDQLQQHYRAIHPTKGFYRNSATESLESWNQSVDEVLEANNMAGPDAEPTYDWHRLRAQVQRWQDDARYQSYLNPGTVAELARRIEEHFLANPEVAPAPVDARNGEWAVAAPLEVRWDIGEGGDVAAQPPMPPFDVIVDELGVDLQEEF